MPINVNAFTGTGNARAKNPSFKVGRGSNGNMLIAEANNYNDLTFTDADLYDQQPLFVDSTIKEVADPLEQDFLDGTSAANPTELGTSRVEGDTSVLASCEGTPIFWAGITQQRLGGGTAIGTAGMVTLFPDGPVGSSTGTITLSATGFSNLRSGASEPALQLIVTFGAGLTSANFHGDSKVGIMDIIGTDVNGTVIEDQIAVYRGDIPSPSVFRTSKFFKTVTRITVRGFQAAVTAAITASNTAQTAVFTPQDQELVRFYGLEIDKPIPNFYYGMCMNSLEVSVAANAVSSISVGWMGMRLNSYRNILSTAAVNPIDPNTGNPASTSTPVDFASPERTIASITGVTQADNSVYPGWSAELTVNGYTLPLLDGTFSINQNLTPSNVIAGVQHQAFPPYGAEKREVMISGNIIYSGSVDYNAIWKDREYSSVILALKFNRKGMFDYETCFIMPDAQLESSPDPDISDRGEPTMPIAFKAKRRPPLDSEYNIEGRYGNYQAPNNY